MSMQSILRAAEILRLQPSGAMPAPQLHARLVREIGDAAGTYAEMCHLLKNRPQSFMVLDVPYGAVLRAAGIETETKIALVEHDEQARSAIGLAGQSVGSLWLNAQHDDQLRAFLSGALEQLVEIGEVMKDDAAARPTTPLRGPPPRP